MHRPFKRSLTHLYDSGMTGLSLWRSVCVALTITAIFLTPAASQFYLDGEIRPRTEFRHGYQTLMSPDEDAAFFISQRTRLNLGHTENNFSLGMKLQDIRVWGEVPQLVRTGENTTVHEAWAEVRLTGRAYLKAGRQEIIYDDHRIFGNVDWAQQGRSHDAAIFKWYGDFIDMHAGFAFNQQSEQITGTTYHTDNYKTFQYLWLNRVWETLEASVLILNNGWQHAPDNTVFSQTAGGRIFYTPGNYSISGAAYLQSGRDPSNRSLSAHYLSSELIFPVSQVVSIQTGFEVLSGTGQQDMEDPEYDKNNSFNPLYGTNHKFNGHMDYFYVGRHINNVGLRDFYGGMTYTPGRWSAGFRLHLFASDALLEDPGAPGENMPRYLGTEADFYFGIQMYDQVNLRFGYSQMFASESMEVLKGGSRQELNNWAWVMLVITPEFFTTFR